MDKLRLSLRSSVTSYLRTDTVIQEAFRKTSQRFQFVSVLKFEPLNCTFLSLQHEPNFILGPL